MSSLKKIYTLWKPLKTIVLTIDKSLILVSGRNDWFYIYSSVLVFGYQDIQPVSYTIEQSANRYALQPLVNSGTGGREGCFINKFY